MTGPGVTRDLERLSRTLERKLSVVEQVRQFLRELIVSGKIKSGERVVETRIARQLGIGQPTVREALEALRDQGLVVRHPNRGCTVVELSAVEVRQIFRLRIEWEALAIELAMEDWTSAKSQQLTKALENLHTAARAGDAQMFYDADLKFHQTLWRLADNLFLERALDQITIPLFAFVMIQVVARQTIDLRAAYGDHARIVEIILEGDRKRAMRITREVLGAFEQAALEIAEGNESQRPRLHPKVR